MALPLTTVFDGDLTTTTSTVLYTAPAGGFLLTGYRFANRDSAARTVTVTAKGTILVPTVSIGANGMYIVEEKVALDEGETILGGASAASVVSMFITGMLGA